MSWAFEVPEVAFWLQNLLLTFRRRKIWKSFSQKNNKQTRIPISDKKKVENRKNQSEAIFIFSHSFSFSLSKMKSSLCHPPPSCLSNRTKSSLQTIFTHPVKAFCMKSMENVLQWMCVCALGWMAKKHEKISD